MVYSTPELLLVGEAKNFVLGDVKQPNIDVDQSYFTDPLLEAPREDAW